MSYSIKFKDVATAIAAFSVSGVTIQNLTTIPENTTLAGPTLFPNSNFVTNMQVTRATFGTAGAERIDIEYDLNYIYTHCAIGSGVGSFAPYSAMIDKIILMQLAFMNNDNVRDGTSLTFGTIGNIGAVTDAAGNSYWGCSITAHVLEFSEVA